MTRLRIEDVQPILIDLQPYRLVGVEGDIGRGTHHRRDRADADMNARYAMPLSSWPSDVTQHCASIAVDLLAAMVGYAPQAGSDVNLERNYYIAVGGGPFREPGYFVGIERQNIHPAVVPAVPVGSDPGHDAPQVVSDQPRGWQQFTRSGRPAIGGF